jgi:ESF2/ABP1 family protein
MKSVHFTEGWVEFDSKRVAKNVAEFLNNTPISTKKGSKFYDVLWNIKYLSRFKWTHLSERLTYEKAVQRQKMQVEVAQARKEASFFQNNLDKSEKDKKMAKKLKAGKVSS